MARRKVIALKRHKPPPSIVVDCAQAAATGTQFNLITSPDGIGNDAVIAAGYIDAVDVWGWLGGGIEVCFQQSSGAITFLDAATSPRAVTTLPAYSANGMVCTFVDRPGTVVLVPGPVPAAASDAAPDAASAKGGSTLTNCMVDLTHTLNFRDAPGGNVIGGIPYNATLTVLARSPGWFQLDYHGEAGWLSADYVVPQEGCG